MSINEDCNVKKQVIINILMSILLVTVIFSFFGEKDSDMASPANQVSYTEMVNKLKDGTITSLKIDQGTQKAIGMTKDGSLYATNILPGDNLLMGAVEQGKVDMEIIQPKKESGGISQFLWSFGPVLLLIGAMLFILNKQRGGGGAMSFGKSKAQRIDPATNSIRLKDVAGCDEAKQEVAEVVDFLRDPSKFQELGAEIPRGVLMSGPPGTGKTLLAKAIAGEAGVPFFSVSGSDFVEMFVGVGAARVRDMFAEASKNAPSIIFIDEIDAIGRARSNGPGGGGNDEREQTLNQMLVQMDGFGHNSGVIVIAATNRPDMLDPALRRPGRFDREVVIGLPDVRGREQILNVHAKSKKVKMSADVNLNAIARGTAGFSGAELSNLINEAALMAARANRKVIGNIDFEEARDKIIMGYKRENAIMPEKEKETTAYHEAGHAIVAHFIPEADPLHKVTIIPRGRALGVTMQLPNEDRYGYDINDLKANIAVLLAGRLAEEMFLERMTTGASNDIERATSLAQNMVTKWGMSSLGMIHLGTTSGSGFKGDTGGQSNPMSGTMASKVEAEVTKILQEEYSRVKNLLKEHKRELYLLAEALLERETLDIVEMEILFKDGKLPPMETIETEVQDDEDKDEESGNKSNKKKKRTPRILEELFEPNWGGSGVTARKSIEE